MNQETIQTELLQLLNQVNKDPQHAKLIAEKALVRSQKNGWIRSLALANLVIGWANLKQNFTDESIVFFQRASTLLKDSQEPEYLADSCFGLGSAYVSIGEFTLAIEQYRIALAHISRENVRKELVPLLRINLTRGLMNLGYWSDAEQELLSIDEELNINDIYLAEYQLLVLRLAFYRGNQRSVKEHLHLCRNLILNIEHPILLMELEYYCSRYIAKYEKLKTGEAQLSDMWYSHENKNLEFYFLAFEAAQDLLQSDYPQKGVYWLNVLLDESEIPVILVQKINFTLAQFYVSHKSYELATQHFLIAEKKSRQVRESEVNQQWVRYRAEDLHHELRSQVDQHKKNNQILAESNALLQVVNRIAMAVNSALGQESMLRRLREQLSGWIDIEVMAMAELKDEQLYFDCIIEGEKRQPPDCMPLTEDRAWSVRAVKEGRILVENDFIMTDEIVMIESPNMVRSVSFIPLKCENRIIGLLSLQSRHANAFSSKAISLLEYIAPVIGISFANIINLQRTRELSGALYKQRQELDDVRQLVSHIADHDDLTGLPNRTSLPEHFAQWKTHRKFHCLLIKISNLDHVNSSAGFGVDEEVIRIISQRLENRTRPDDLLVRTSADQFLLFAQLMSSKEDVQEFAKQLIQFVVQPLRAKDKTIGAEASIGVVQYPDHGNSLDEIMSMASVALSHAIDDESSICCID